MSKALWLTAALAASGCLTPEWSPALDAGAGIACSHATCTGCCDQGVCVSGYADEACGLLGRRCDACGIDQVCGPTRSCQARPPDAGPPWDKRYPVGVSGAGNNDPPSDPPARCQYNCR